MSNDLTPQFHAPAPFGPQGRAAMANINAGAVSIEQERAVAEARGQMQLAKMFPRDLNSAYAELMTACKLPAMANVAFYSVPQGGQKVTGPSIRLAEQIASSCGNFEWGHRELSRVEATATEFGRSEIEVYAWDKEKNTRSIRQITVLHVLDTREGPRRLRDQKDIDNKIANVASKQARGRILALVPKWIIEACVEECKKTLAGNNEVPLDVRVRAMTQAFAKFGVTTEHLEKYLGHKLDAVLSDELVDLTGVYNSIKEGTAPSEFFGEQAQDEGGEQKAATSVADTAKAARAARTAAPKAAPAPAAETPAPAAAATPAPAPAADQADPPAEKSKPEQKASKKQNDTTQQQAPEPEPQDGAAPDGQGGEKQEGDFF